ncbi:putative nuclear pore protein [Spironucleus salmonicida]|uniref:Nuclear pore protein n=1 Tax=Spironucleus salmonicida TaxID=348837 RepID=V6LGZ7_9EUKA|nr:putative nuclear pore protein [Spironucleus salmonicida]|eukprot:EST43583.1 Putative nuclear pore protein [Spironucleus salmonicida]
MDKSSSLSAEDLQNSGKGMVSSVVGIVSGFFKKNIRQQEPVQKPQQNSFDTSFVQRMPSSVSSSVTRSAVHQNLGAEYVVLPQRLLNAFFEYQKEIQSLETRREQEIQDIVDSITSLKNENASLIDQAQKLRDCFLLERKQITTISAPKLKIQAEQKFQPPAQPQQAAPTKPAFTFNDTAKSAEIPVSAPQQFQETQKPTFSFGQNAVQPPQEASVPVPQKPTFSFGGNAQTSQPVAPKSQEPAKPTFSFGANSAPQAQAEKPTFSFGGAPVQEDPKAISGPPKFNFEATAQPVQPENMAPATFSFGQNAVQKQEEVKPAEMTSFKFGNAQVTAEKPMFGAVSQQEQQKPAEQVQFKFGNAQVTADKPMFGAPVKPAEQSAPAFGDNGNGFNFNFKMGQK